jgi:hypothetical protein
LGRKVFFLSFLSRKQAVSPFGCIHLIKCWGLSIS